MTTPVVSNFLFEEDDGGLMGAKTCYVQTISFPGSHLWIWIGDKSAGAPNLSLAMGSRNGPANQVLSTNVMNATRTDELSSQCRSLGEKISKKLGGKPVYLSCSLPEEVTMAMEKDLFRTIKLHPERF